MTRYINPADVRLAGLGPEVANDSAVLAAIDTWQQFLERACRQWFYPRALDFRFDGTDSDTINFGVPIISVENLWVNLGTTQQQPLPLDPTRYCVYSSAGGVQDDRRNPRIKIVAFEQVRDIFTAPIVQPNTKLRFRKGRQNQRVVGTFGFVEPDGSTPRLIKRALTKLVVEKLASPIYVGASGTEPDPPPPLLAGVLASETTDLHSMTYQQAPFRARGVGLIGITKDQEVLDVIRLYRAPIGVATPAHFSAS